MMLVAMIRALRREASASTDITFKSAIYSYAKTKGLFLGIAIDGSVLTIDQKANETFYVNLEMVGSTIERFHGWINKATRRIVQVG